MTPEERERFKEAEKEHLRKLKKLKEQAHLARRRASVNKALSDMAGALGQDDDPLDAHNEMMDKLALETAQGEARLEIALENAALEEAAQSKTPSPEELEEEMVKERAKMLLEQMKLQMGMAAPPAQEEAPSKTISKHAVPKPPPAEPETPASDASEQPSPPVERPEKTIGRIK